MDPDQLFFGRALRRIQVFILVLGGAGTIAAAVYAGWRWAAGYLLGAAASYLNFRWIERLVKFLGEAAAGKPPRKRVALLMGLRYLLLGIAGYAILNYSALSLASVFTGLFAPVAAVVLEILFQLAYAGK